MVELILDPVRKGFIVRSGSRLVKGKRSRCQIFSGNFVIAIIEKISLVGTAIIVVLQPPLSLNLYLAVIIALGAALIDIKSSKIPNYLTFPAMVLGLSYFGYDEGWRGYLSSLAGLGLGMGLFMPLYLLGGMGAGDVKLMGAMGALVGMGLAFKAVIAATLVGGVLSVLTLAIQGQLSRIIKRYWLILKLLLFTGEISYIPLEGEIKQTKIHYGVAIALGTMILILVEEGL